MADNWEVRVTRSADREVSSLPAAIASEAAAVIAELAESPFPQGWIAMRRYNDQFRIRFGGDRYRIVYRVDRKHRVVTILRVRPRGTAYHGMRNPELAAAAPR